MSTTTEEQIAERARALETAQAEQERARLHDLAAAEIAAETAAEERRHQFEAFVEQMPKRITAASVDREQRAMEKAVMAYAAACAQRRAVQDEAWTFIVSETGGVGQGRGGLSTEQSGAVTIGRERFGPVDPQRAVYEALVAALGEHFPTTMLRFDWRY